MAKDTYKDIYDDDVLENEDVLDEIDLEIDEDYPLPRKKRKKTLKEKLRYRGSFELLPERENWKQIRFYYRLFIFRYVPIITSIFSLAFGYAALKYNSLFAIVALIAAIPGIFWAILGVFKIRGWRFFLVLTGLVLNVIAIIMVIVPFTGIIGSLGTMWQLILDFFLTFGV